MESEPAKYSVVHLEDLEAVSCPCGMTRRAFVHDPEQRTSMHLVDIQSDAKVHYHKKLTEIYYILEGEGQMELDGSLVDVRPGCAILIKPGCRHRAVGAMKILNVVIPAFDPDDEWFD